MTTVNVTVDESVPVPSAHALFGLGAEVFNLNDMFFTAWRRAGKSPEEAALFADRR